MALLDVSKSEGVFREGYEDFEGLGSKVQGNHIEN